MQRISEKVAAKTAVMFVLLRPFCSVQHTDLSCNLLPQLEKGVDECGPKPIFAATHIWREKKSAQAQTAGEWKVASGI